MADGKPETDQTESKWRSRKFMVTVGGVVLAGLAVYFDKLSPELANVILAAIASYNVSNAFQRK